MALKRPALRSSIRARDCGCAGECLCPGALRARAPRRRSRRANSHGRRHRSEGRHAATAAQPSPPRSNGPKHLCIDQDGAVIIADTENHAIRKYFPKDGKIVRLAGKGTRGTSGVGGPALEVEMNQPHGVYVHPSGDLYITDSTNRRILKIVRAK